MLIKNNMLSTALPYVHGPKSWSRLRLALAGSSIAIVMVLSGLSGFLTGYPAVQARTFRIHSPLLHSVSTSSIAIERMSLHTTNDYMSIARQAAINAGISPEAFVRQIQQESGFNVNAVSPTGAAGIAQFMPGTAASMGINPYDPVQAITGMANMMASQAAAFGGDYAKALAAYNAGPGAVQAAVAQGGSNWLAYMPIETQNYVHSIMG